VEFYHRPEEAGGRFFAEKSKLLAFGEDILGTKMVQVRC